MTKAERTLVLNWSDPICKEQEEQRAVFKELQELAVRRGRGAACYSLERNLEWLLTCEDKSARNNAFSLYSRYYELSGRYSAMLELTQGFADLSGKSFQVSKEDAHEQ